MKIGYARVSTKDQNLDLQIEDLKKFGCEQIFTDRASGAKSDRPGLNDVFRFLREGDTLVVWKLDRLGRSISHLIKIMQDINTRGSFFHSLHENIDTSSSFGKLIFHFISALAEFERGIIIERVQAGLAMARARGRLGGRRYKLNPEQKTRLKEVYDSKIISINEICKMFNISKRSLYNYLALPKPVKEKECLK